MTKNSFLCTVAVAATLSVATAAPAPSKTAAKPAVVDKARSEELTSELQSH